MYSFDVATIRNAGRCAAILWKATRGFDAGANCSSKKPRLSMLAEFGVFALGKGLNCSRRRITVATWLASCSRPMP